MAKKQTLQKLCDDNPKLTKHATIHIAHGSGMEKIEVAKEIDLKVFEQNVTKRDLQAFPWKFKDMHNNEYILRQFLFAKIVRH